MRIASARREMRRWNIVFLAGWMMLLSSEWILLPAAGAASDASPGSDSWDKEREATAAAAAIVAAASVGFGRRQGEAGWRPRDRRRDHDDSRRRPRVLVDDSDSVGDAARRRQPRRRRRLEPQLGGAVNGDETGQGIERLAGQRDYLNGLVDETAAATGKQACNIAFAKTHKTASTTMAMILVRYARRHDKKLASFGGNHVSEIPLGEAVRQVERSGERVDVMHYHYTVSGSFQGRWAQATAMYEKIMQQNERISYVTVVRSPRAHFLSYYYYYVQPEVQLSVMHFFGSKRTDKKFKNQQRRLANPLCSEFGITNGEDLEHFIKAELPDFRLVLLTEAFDEGLMIMRRLLGWEMIDMTYSKMMQTKAGSRRWDGKELKDVPHWDDLPDWVQDRVDANTALDRILYDAAEKHYNEMKAVAAIEIESDLKEFEELQEVVNTYLHENSSSPARHWYSGRAEPYRGGEPFAPF
eukprot:g5759.t2